LDRMADNLLFYLDIDRIDITESRLWLYFTKS